MTEDNPSITIHDPPENPQGHGIRVVARKTGLSVDTLRMWERRYGFPSPQRDDFNNRLYGNDEIERLSLIARAMKLGVRVGEAVRLPQNALTALVDGMPKTTEPRSGHRLDLDAFLVELRDDNPTALVILLRRAALKLGAYQFVTDVAAPLLELVGNSWAAGTLGIYQEHLLSELLGHELRMLAKDLEPPQGPTLLVATLARETHSLGLEMLSVMARLFGARTHSLGCGVPCAELARAATAIRPEALALSISACSPPTALNDQLEQLVDQLPGSVELWIGGKGTNIIEALPSRTRRLESWDDLELAVSRLIQGR